MDTLIKKIMILVNICIKKGLFGISTILSTLCLTFSIAFLSVTTVQLNNLFLGNFSALNLKVFIYYTLFAGLFFSIFIISLNYIAFKKLKTNRRFLELKIIIAFFAFHIFSVYITLYLATALFYFLIYGTLMPDDLEYVFNNVFKTKNFLISNPGIFISMIHYALAILSIRLIYSLYYNPQKIKTFFDLGNTSITILYLEKKIQEYEEKHVIKSKSKMSSLIEKTFDYEKIELLYIRCIYLFALVGLLHSFIFTFIVAKDIISSEHIFLDFIMKSQPLHIVFPLFFTIIPAYILSEVKGIYGFKITSYIDINKIKKAINFYCIYLSIIISAFITSFITGINDLLELGNITVPINSQAFQLVVIFLGSNYLISKCCNVFKDIAIYVIERF